MTLRSYAPLEAYSAGGTNCRLGCRLGCRLSCRLLYTKNKCATSNTRSVGSISVFTQAAVNTINRLVNLVACSYLLLEGCVPLARESPRFLAALVHLVLQLLVLGERYGAATQLLGVLPGGAYGSTAALYTTRGVVTMYQVCSRYKC